MNHIFIQNRVLRFESASVSLSDNTIKDIAVSFRDAADDAVISCDNPEKAYRLVCSTFKEVNAAGGVVCDGSGRCLLIRRSGLWDIPKGHQESGEDIETTAVREVEEETGVSGLRLGKLICITDHCYVREGIWHLKHTWWYRMECSGNGRTVPQTEEDITEAVWVPREELERIAAGTYPSIAQVLSFL